MTRYLLPLLLVAGATPAFAQTSGTPYSFERDGIRYNATVRTVGATRIISGTEATTGKRFELRSANGRVTGMYDAVPVDYSLPASTGR